MKVLYFSDNTSGHNQRFLEKLSQAGLEVWFLDPTSNCVAEGWLPQGVHWVRAKRTIPQNSDLATFADFLPEFQRVLCEIAPDLVHAGPIQSCGHVTALSRFHPWLLTSWGSDLLFHAEQRPEWKQAAQVALSSADAFFCDCDTVRKTRQNNWRRYRTRASCSFPGASGRDCLDQLALCHRTKSASANQGRMFSFPRARGSHFMESTFSSKHFDGLTG